jgi:retron-type reverse transcriptase
MSYQKVKKITAGVPQGAVISPILCSIFINDIQNNRSNVKFSLLYADDLSSFFIFGKNGSIENSVNAYLRKIKAWLCNWKLNLSANKCNYIVFTQNKKANFEFNLYLSKKKEKKLEEKNPKEENPVFLGVTFDKFLNFNTHFSNL